MRISPQAIPDYTQLHHFLARQSWKEADDETAKIMLRIANREEEGWLDSQSIAKFPCAELQRIDQLWMEHSKGRFGFTVQKNIWIECGGRIDYETECLLGERVGWYADGRGWLLVSEENRIYNLTASLGHLPMLWLEAKKGIFFRWIQCVEVMHSALAARISMCSSPLNSFKELFAESPMEVFDDPTISLSTLEENSEFFTDLCCHCPGNILRDEHLPIHWQTWLANHPYKGLREMIAHNPYLPKESIAILASDEDHTVRDAIAENRNTPQEILSALATDEYRNVRLHVAGHTNAPSDALVSLATDEDYCIRSYVAENLNTPADVLIQLAKDEDRRVRDDVAKNPNTPVEILIQLIEDTFNGVRMSSVENSNLPIDLLINLAESDDYILRRAVADNPNTPSEVLIKLANDSNRSVVSYVAENPNTPSEVLINLGNTSSHSVASGVAENPNTPDFVLRRLATSEYSSEYGGEYYLDVRCQLATNINTPSDLLVQMAQDDDEITLRNVVENPNTPQDALTLALTKLAKDVSVQARFEAAKNAATPKDVLAELLYDINPEVSFYASVNPNTPEHDGLMHKLIELAEGNSQQRAWVATHPSLPPEILSRLAKDTDSTVRLNVTLNLNIPIETLVKLADDKNSKVKFNTAVNPNTPSSLSQQLLSNLANDKDSMVRLHVAKFFKTPVDVLVKLAQDEHSEVRREATKNLNTPRELLSD